MIVQTGQQKLSPIPGKKQNCPYFATYEPLYSTRAAKAMCHGGTYEGDTYRECPVKAECKQATENKARGLPVLNDAQRPTRSFGYTVPDFTAMPTTLEQFVARSSSAAPQSTTAPAPQQQPRVIRTPQQAAAEQARAREATTFGSAVMPSENAPPGLRTAYMHPVNPGEISPTYLPAEKESIWDRLLKNIVQGIIAAIGWHIWRMASQIDFFVHA